MAFHTASTHATTLAASTVSMQPPRKRLRRAVNCCLECRRRKVRCDLSSQDWSTCSACALRSIPCEKVANPRGPEPDDGSGGGDLGTRLQRVERLLDEIVAVDGDGEGDGDEARADPGASVAPDLGPGSVSTTIQGDHEPPLIPLFDNEVFGRQEKPVASTGGDHGLQAPVAPVGPSSKRDKLRLALVALLPTQDDANLIAASTNGWGLEQVLRGVHDEPGPDGPNKVVFDIDTISQGSPVIIARNLLSLAICIQQLPPEFDTARLRLGPSVEAVLKRYLRAVSDWVTSKDDMVCCLDGLQCLLLQIVFLINDGNPRRAWLVARRALSVAQFLGLQKPVVGRARGGFSSEVDKERASVWRKVVTADCYLSVLLGLQCGVADDHGGDLEAADDPASTDDMFERKICVIAGLVAQRNQHDPCADYAATRDIDRKLDALARELATRLTDIPEFRGVRSVVEAANFARLARQMWFYQLTQWVHIPWMLRAFTDDRYGYNRLKCLNAARELIRRYLALRNINNTQLQARVVDFATIIASVTLVLHFVAAQADWRCDNGMRYYDEADMDLVQQVVKSMETVGRGPREFMARQGVDVIRTLLTVNDGRPEASTPDAKIRITVPFYGAITISRNPHAFPPRDDGAAKDVSIGCRLRGPGHGDTTSAHHLSFDATHPSETSWFPPLDAWDFDSAESFTLEPWAVWP